MRGRATVQAVEAALQEASGLARPPRIDVAGGVAGTLRRREQHAVAVGVERGAGVVRAAAAPSGNSSAGRVALGWISGPRGPGVSGVCCPSTLERSLTMATKKKPAKKAAAKKPAKKAAKKK
jgi:hypothetical protein